MLPLIACCSTFTLGQPVVNADQTVILVYDAATKTEHFIRQAAFRGAGADFGFLVPTPSEPEVAESGDEAFPLLKTFTEPEQVTRWTGPNIGGCGGEAHATFGAVKSDVSVLQRKEVSGYDVAVLAAKTPDALIGWLSTNGYGYTPEVAGWLKPYLGAGWKISAFKLASGNSVTKAVRLSFLTDRLLFPYREPDYREIPGDLKRQRMLRVYVLADSRQRGGFDSGKTWENAVWSGPLTEGQSNAVTTALKIPNGTYTLTEFEHVWPYDVAPGDVYFSRDADQRIVKRPPIVTYREDPIRVWAYGLVCLAVFLSPFVLLAWLARRWWRWRRTNQRTI